MTQEEFIGVGKVNLIDQRGYSEFDRAEIDVYTYTMKFIFNDSTRIIRFGIGLCLDSQP
jgi:hypothetical protein